MKSANSFSSYSLSRRLLISIIFCSAIFALLATAFQLHFDFNADVKEIDRNLTEMESSYVNSIASSLWLVDRDQVYLQLQGILELPDIRYIHLDVIDDSDYQVGTKPTSKDILHHTLDLYYGSGSDRQKLGTMQVYADFTNVHKRLRTKAIYVLLIQTLYTFLVSVFILLIFRFMVTRHLATMAHFVSDLSLDNLDSELKLERKTNKSNENDELSYVVNAINYMREQMYNDIIKREAIEKALLSNKERFEMLYNQNPSMYFTLALDGELISINDFGAQQLGYVTEELIGVNIANLYQNGEVDSVVHRLDMDSDDESKIYRRDVCVVRKDNSNMWVRETARLVNSELGEKNILMVSEDITEAHNLSENLAHQASHDALTGLVNRVEFEHRVTQIIEIYASNSNNAKHALLYLDLDQFKIINDTCGHVAGDELLRQLSSLLQEHMRVGDTLARLGGDEFGVLLADCAESHALLLAEGLCDAVSAYQFYWGVSNFRVGVSIGLVMIDAKTSNCSKAMSQADSACYVAKDLGRNRVHVYSEDDAELAKRADEMMWVSRIEAAMEENRFEIFFQPIVPIYQDASLPSTPDATHYEILVRMRAEDHKSIIPPGEFLPAAERYNLMLRIDRQILRQTLDWLSKNPKLQDVLEVCSINLSGQTLMDESFIDFVFAEFKRTNVPPTKICFEVTETAAIANLSKACVFIAAIRERGCKFSLDDFGSGLSSFAYLKNLPVDFIKIDGLFVKDIVKDSIDFAMVRSIHQVAQVMGKETVAEFVEDEVVLDALRNIGVNYAQGYYIGRPQPIDTLESINTAVNG